ncbi:hypothetical protein ACFU5O_00855 [Streptomyces sp. NPDC057445]|uniref:hypothetical protein n=1 Tax=Streptomyces sp. NPDC057445 TaxID=3346136 RepID=UPI0036A0AA82
MGGPRRSRIARIARPVALGSAVATLLAALFICPGGLAAAGPGSGTVHAGGSHGITTAPRAAVGTSEFICPYDRGDCGLLPHLTQAVLTAPPQDGPVSGAQPSPGAATGHRTGQVPRTGALARAPDLHVLQVLRT